ncbi:hypothetical protein Glove_123g161 [Diversispora epigaea]|uniref:AAA-ATPase-like domain-containing protein n=1 Tax=Diversispora epigaea TaxID=1348612 RepID=A0A397J8M4_9GLOM|nr:hypothetical protein Glove_123g161 [Diversispora epigaea]
MLGSKFEPYTNLVFGASVIVGDDDFKNIIISRLTFVDKSMLVKEFTESSDFASLILRPRRFGKSINLSMLNCFFKIPYSQEENDINRKLFENLKISNEKEIMQNHFAQYPVIYITLKELTAHSGTWDKMMIRLRVLMANIYGEHRYLIKSLYSDEQRRYQKILDRDPTYPELELVVVFGASVIVGDDDFKNIIISRLTFVDKSMLVKEFTESSDFASLILRPRRFGKSINLSMLNCFFKIPYSQEENDINRKLFENLKISNEKEIMQNHFAQYPVIYITLKELTAHSGTWDKMMIRLRVLMANIYGEHRYLIKSLYSDEQRRYQKILDRDPTYPELELVSALQELSTYLRQHYKKQCIVLIDEYDSPMECAYNKGYYESNSENVAKAMLVDILPIAKSGLNNLMVYKKVDLYLYVDKFGFTSNEVELLSSLRGIIHLYNPWSIIRLLSLGKLNSYWTDTGSSQTLEKCLWKTSSSFKESVENLLKGERITDIKIKDDFQYSYLGQYKDEDIWTHLYYAGYLTMNSEKHLVILNEEIHSEWHKWIINAPFFTQNNTIESMLKELLNGNLKSFKKKFEEMIVDTLSYHDVGGSLSGKNAEYVYHAFCLGMFVHAHDLGYIVHSNREAGMGRYDMGIVPKSGSSVYMIWLMKDYAKLKKKQYRVGFQESIKRLLEIGIVFEGKNACVSGHLLHRTEEGVWNKDYETLISD